MAGPIVDRVDELDFFTKSLANRSSQQSSILLIEDASGQGKTKLIELYQQHCVKQQLYKAHIDLKAGSLTPLDILETLCTDIKDLSCCKEAISQPQIAPPLHISDNKTLGQASYIVHNTYPSNSTTLEEQKQWWRSGASAFFEDIRTNNAFNSKRMVLLFDTFEKASPETQEWISNQILRMATPERNPNLYIVIAGKQLPEPSGEWARYSHKLPLPPLLIEHWYQYGELVHSTLTHRQIKQLYQKHQTSPKKMADIIGTFSEERSN